MVDIEELKGKTFSFGGNGNDKGEDKSKSNYWDEKSKPKKDPEIILKAPDIPGKDYVEFVVNMIKKTVKQEDALIRQILYTGLSADTKEPMNLGILAPTSEGKTYPVIESMKYFPKSQVWYIGSMSTKVLVRQKGILVDSNNKPIEPQIIELKRIIKDEKLDDDTRESKKEELAKLYTESKNLIDLNGIVLAFLEPPHADLWNMLKPILSHDTQEIEYDYVDKTERRGIETKKVIVRGWPACIFCSAKDESNWPTWPEIVSRFLITSPNMISKKYEESNQLIAQRKGLPSLIQEQLIISQNDIELAEKCILYLQNLLLSNSKNKSDVWIPYGGILGEALKADKGTDVRNTKRIFSLLNIISLVKSDNRPKLLLKGKISIVATLEDLSEVLSITQNLNGIPAYKMKFLKDIFISLYESKTAISESEDGKKKESRIAVTSKELAIEYTKKNKRAINAENIRKNFLNEYLNNGLIDEETSVIDHRQKIYYPIVGLDGDLDDTNSSQEKIWKCGIGKHFHNFLHHSEIILPKNCKQIDENWLLFGILSFFEYGIQLEDIEIQNNMGEKQTIKQFISDYEHSVSLIPYFKKVYSCKYSSKILGTMKYIGKYDKKDVEKCGIGSESCVSVFSDDKIDEKPQKSLEKGREDEAAEDILSDANNRNSLYDLLDGPPPERPPAFRDKIEKK